MPCRARCTTCSSGARISARPRSARPSRVSRSSPSTTSSVSSASNLARSCSPSRRCTSWRCARSSFTSWWCRLATKPPRRAWARATRVTRGRVGTWVAAGGTQRRAPIPPPMKHWSRSVPSDSRPSSPPMPASRRSADAPSNDSDSGSARGHARRMSTSAALVSGEEVFISRPPRPTKRWTLEGARSTAGSPRLPENSKASDSATDARISRCSVTSSWAMIVERNCRLRTKSMYCSRDSSSGAMRSRVSRAFGVSPCVSIICGSASPTYCRRCSSRRCASSWK